MNIYLKIKELRDSKKLSQIDFANEIGVSRSTLSQIELEKQKPTIDTIKKIAIKYNIPYEYFFDDDYSFSSISNKEADIKKPPGECPNCIVLQHELRSAEKALDLSQNALKHAESEIESRKEIASLLIERVNDLTDKLSRFENAQDDSGQKRKSA